MPRTARFAISADVIRNRHSVWRSDSKFAEITTVRTEVYFVCELWIMSADPLTRD